MNGFADRRGSIWRRWDPHLHTPGTALNDQFRGADAWERWLTAVESAAPKIEALGVTDYWSVDNYETVVEHRRAGRLRDVQLLFPNVELRLGIGTLRGKAINAHLLVAPDDADHVAQIRRFLQALSFRFKDEVYRCTREDLILLGRAHDPDASDDGAALKVGSNQFKVTLDALKEAFGQSAWARGNVLLAVAAGRGDGSSGLQRDESFAALRKDLERTATVILSSNAKDRAFWSGLGDLAETEIIETYGALKVCLHGSDAHKTQDVGAPDLDRCQWIKGDTMFESLRQACIEPATRAWIGDTPPSGALPYRTVTDVRLSNAPWATNPAVPLNSGLVGIIGARGSGKTALADLIAATAGSDDPLTNESSFLRRAGEHIATLAVELAWGDGDVSHGPPRELQEPASSPDVQYLSQQFVERLCTAEGGLSDELLAEIERVIYAEHTPETRAGTTSFAELRDARTAGPRLEQQRRGSAIADAAAQLNIERGKRDELPALRTKREGDARRIEQDRTARASLTVIGGEERATRLAELTAAVETRQAKLDALERQRISIEAIRNEVESLRGHGLRREEDRLRSLHAVSGLSDDDWRAFRLRFEGDVDEILDRRSAKIAQAKQVIAGQESPLEQQGEQAPLAQDAKLDQVPVAALRRETVRLQAEIGLDKRKQTQLAKLNVSIADAEVGLARLDEQIKDADGAEERMATLRTRWEEEYRGAFAAIEAEEDELRLLYEPLAEAISAEGGLIEKLTFVVRRDVDLTAWAIAGEDLLDLRKIGPFKGRGRLLELATETLKRVWEAGTAEEVSQAMKAFRDAHDGDLAAHSPESSQDRAAYQAWGTKMSRWLASTDHVTIRYGVQYEGVDIESLSPGTRGIVLLLLYLAIDRNDDRPLIIDQPEENLDPKSIFDELVYRFRSVRERRQVIIVTHNANLVVNTDVDQVIVASAGPHRPGDLPQITWLSGGLENPDIRREVCSILEGGEQAFLERARRLRVSTA